MSRRIITMALAGITPSLIAYATTAFVFWQANPAFWSVSARGIIAVASVAIGALAANYASITAGGAHD